MKSFDAVGRSETLQARHSPKFLIEIIMDIITTKKFPNTPFIIETSPIENRPGTWNSTKVSIYRDEILIGEYIRNYSNYGQQTFYPFKQGDDWYAVYSANYTTTRVMKLHIDRIEDWCGEENDANGFCPVEMYIPSYITSICKFKIKDEEHESEYYVTDCPSSIEEFDEELNNPPVKLDYCDFGFLCGCIWGDDSSWKIRYIDLSQIPNKVLSVIEKFGYWEMPNSLTLKECIDMSNWAPSHDCISLIKAENVNLRTGQIY